VTVRRLLSLLAVLLACVTVLPAPFAAAAAAPATAPAAGPCLENGTGPQCSFWYGTVQGISDGDTLDVLVDHSGSQHVRLGGVQAMELTVYSRTAERRRGECSAVEAAARLQQMVPPGTRVRLAAEREGSRSGARPRRSVFVERDGVWRDVARTLLREGHGLWLPASDEPAHNAEYDLLAQQAKAARVGVWNPARCGRGPAPDAGLQVWATWDANGTEGVDLNGEFVQIKNPTASDVALGGWWVRESGYRGRWGRGFEFPAGAVVRAGRTVTVFVGTGAGTATRFYWGQRSPVFENVSSALGRGDGAYLFDPQGNLRASMVYPCRVACAAPLRGRVSVAARWNPPGADTAAGEAVVIRNHSRASAVLEGHQLWSWPYGYTFPPGTVLAAGESLRVRLDRGRSSRLTHYWGLGVPALGNAGDGVVLRSLGNVAVTCHSWGVAKGCRTSD